MMLHPTDPYFEEIHPEEDDGLGEEPELEEEE
jgi:hypothetical protein